MASAPAAGQAGPDGAGQARRQTGGPTGGRVAAEALSIVWLHGRHWNNGFRKRQSDDALVITRRSARAVRPTIVASTSTNGPMHAHARTVTSRSSDAVAAQVVASHRPDEAGELFGITALCAEFGISLRTIRFYEDKGLLAPRRVNGARVYTRRDRARLALILRSKAIGASLAEIRHYLDLYGAHGEGRAQQLRFVLERTDATIAALEQRRRHIDATLAELRLINAEARARLETA
jgi:DNA-binding transcriptional MerR regulator